MTTEALGTPEKITLADLRKTCAGSTSGPNALGAILTRYPALKEPDSKTIALIVAILEGALDKKLSYIELYLKDADVKAYMLTSGRIKGHKAIGDCIEILCGTVGSSRYVGVDRNIQHVVPLVPLQGDNQQYGGSGYELHITPDSLAINGRVLWDRELA